MSLDHVYSKKFDDIESQEYKELTKDIKTRVSDFKEEVANGF